MSYDGGKAGAGVFQWIINHMPPHRTYIELFLGDGAVLRAKRPAGRSIGVEINPAVLAQRWQDHGIPGLITWHGDALEWLRRCQHDLGPDMLVYADPPYLLSTRSSQRKLYDFEFMEIEQHRALLRLLCSLHCMVAISGYWSELYELELAGWRHDTFQTVKRSGEAATEYLWMNYPPPLELHDYRYLGRNFRERERIKRKKTRWVERLRGMGELERLALMEAIGELRSTIATGDDAAGAIATNDDIDDLVISSTPAIGTPIAGYDGGSWPASPAPTRDAGIATNGDAGAED